MTAKDLKNALLQEAVQGKLVPQIASEGNARDLLEEIRKEKLSHGLDLRLEASLAINAKSGKRKSKKETALAGSNPCDITEDEIPFDIPESWCWCRLGELGNFVRGSGIKRDETTNTGLPCVRYGEMYTTYKIKFSKTKSFTSKDVFEKCHKIHTNDILMALTGENKWDIALAATYEGTEEIAMGGDLCKFTPINCNSLFLVYLINSPYGIEYKRNTSTGDIIVHTSTTKLGNLLIPLPPLAEQRRIVAAIEKFMPLIEEYGKKETQLKAINEKIGTLTKKAILQEAVQGKIVPQIAAEGNARDLLEEIRKEKLSHGLDFANAKSGKKKSKKETALAGSNPCDITEDEIPFDIPENWCWCRLSELCNLYTGDSINETEKKLKYTNVKEGWFYIGTKDVNFDQTINYDNGIKIPFEKDNFRIAPKNTVLMCIEGGSAGRKIAFTNQDVCFGNKLCCFNSYKNEIEKFIFYFLQSTLFTDAFKDNINGIIGGVSINNLKGMLFPLPPLSEQKRIVAAIEKMLPLCEKLGE
ncbi:MAG: restriction endonuclease subunit S [Treponema sp.]|uniref:restriction endonuclease subunit S n=1 Tax=Treponema succinifaciens TaxID=167 RepID=UPI002A820C0F|nr:restriction endonuclease subunit S [Treponema succinifaciens]MDD6968463.1 restriction endonuclease subunit S [Spirochaetales bacterium]MDY5116844.1 restriction endonuclease subunit S [Treponema succinifaciens]MDY6190051.1 restriction endonuclease subunit S [Treponema sp.]